MRPTRPHLMCLQSHCGGLSRRHFNLGGAPDFVQVKSSLVAVGLDPVVVDDMLLLVDATAVSELPLSSLNPTALYLLSGLLELPSTVPRDSSLPRNKSTTQELKALIHPHGVSPFLRKVHAFLPERATAFEDFCASIRTEQFDSDFLSKQAATVTDMESIGVAQRCMLELSQLQTRPNVSLSAPALRANVDVNSDSAKQHTTASQRTEMNSSHTVSRSKIDPSQLYYLPMLGVAVCICPKCGSTSLFHFIYQVLFGRAWPWLKSEKPFIHNILSRRWQQMWQPLRPENERLLRYRIAFIREPRTRLISGFRDKYECNNGTRRGANASMKHIFTRELLKLEGRRRYLPPPTCLTEELFSTVLGNIKASGMSREANPHIREQSEMCFREHPPAWWDWVGSLGAPEARDKLANALLDHLPALHIPHKHCHERLNKSCTAFLNDMPVVSPQLSPGWTTSFTRWVQRDLDLLSPFLAESRICRASANQRKHPQPQAQVPSVLFAIIPRCSGSTYLHALAHRILNWHNVRLCNYVNADMLRKGSSPSEVAEELSTLPTSFQKEQTKVPWTDGTGVLGKHVSTGVGALRDLHQSNTKGGCTTLVIQHTRSDDGPLLSEAMPILSQLDVPVVIVHRINHLDRLVCEIRDCISKQDIPKELQTLPRLALGVSKYANGTRSKKCMLRRSGSATVFADIGIHRSIPVLRAWSRAPALQAAELQSHGFVDPTILAYEDLTAFGYKADTRSMAPRPNHLNRSLASWTKLLSVWGIRPRVSKLIRALAPDAGKRDSPPPHYATIYNAERVKRALASAGPEFAALYREGAVRHY